MGVSDAKEDEDADPFVRVEGGVDMVDVEGVLVHELDMMLVPAEFMLSKESSKLFSWTFVKKLEFMSSSTLSAWQGVRSSLSVESIFAPLL